MSLDWRQCEGKRGENLAYRTLVEVQFGAGFEDWSLRTAVESKANGISVHGWRA